MFPPFLKVFVLVVLLASVAIADDFKTNNGKEYKNATVSRVEADGIVIRFSGGIVKIAFTELPKEVQERFNYHPGMASAYGATGQEPAHSQSQTQGPVSQSSSEQTDNRGASHILACRGTDHVPIGSSAVFQMQEGETYPVTGVSLNGNLMFATPLGGADFHGDRFRVLNGGQYGGVEVMLKDVKGHAMEHWEENKQGWRTKYSTWTADWTGQVILTGVQPVTQCYAALQWYSDGQPVGAAAKVLGTLNPGRPVDVSLSIPITQAQNGGTFSFHVWSAANELKTIQLEKSEW